MNDTELLTAAELAALLRVHLRTVYTLAKSGAIPAIRLGRGWRFIAADVIERLTKNSDYEYKKRHEKTS